MDRAQRASCFLLRAAMILAEEARDSRRRSGYPPSYLQFYRGPRLRMRLHMESALTRGHVTLHDAFMSVPGREAIQEAAARGVGA